MSGLNEIIQWTEANIDFEKGEDVTKAFDFISREFEQDNRLPLADILGEDISKYLEFLEDSTFTRAEDIELSNLQERFDFLTGEIERLTSSGFNILGTPIR